jgi:peptide/nickel transport system ATP-binding protein
MADEIAVMERGSIVEQGAAGNLMSQPRHPRTRELIAASRVLEEVGG